MKSSTEITIANLLLPTDFSDESAHAVPCAQGLQARYSANVYVIHVLDLLPFSLSTEPAAVAKTEEIRRSGTERLGRFMQSNRLRRDGFEPVVLAGEASSAVDEFAREHQIDLIVVGSRGDVGVRRLFEGSMAEEIFRAAQSPVMVIGPAAKTRGESGVFNHLLFPTDLGGVSRAAVPYVEFLLKGNSHAKVSFAHFLEQDPGTPYQRHRARQRTQQELMNLIAPDLRERIENLAVEFCTPAQGILEMAEGVAADLLVLGVRHGGSFLRASTHGLFSITHHIVSGAPCPVLTVRDTQILRPDPGSAGARPPRSS
jgi:nucleotide-binding universal stress UspA family protein